MASMKRATITLPDDLERELDAYIERQEAGPSITSVVQAALRDFLTAQRLKELEYRPARGPIRITPADAGSGRTDIGIDHDRYLTDRA
jgi:metal-responsive CopG/Arc/MetJ family transcriptional regulator